MRVVVCGLVFASGVGVEFLAFVTSSSLVFLSDLLLCEQKRTVRINSLEYGIESAQTSVIQCDRTVYLCNG